MIELNIANMMEELIGERGVRRQAIDSLAPRIAEAHDVITRRGLPGLAFLDLPGQDISDIRRLGKEVRSDSETFLILGIGGSALGPRAILEALSPLHNLRQMPRVFIYDNVDPRTLDAILSQLDLRRTTVNVISKSGSTAETAAGFMIVWDRLTRQLGDAAASRCIATTDPVDGNLRKTAIETGMRTLPVEKGIGGRFSVLSPVGLLLAEVIGADSAKMLRGAADIQAACTQADVWKNPAYMFGSLLYLLNTDAHRSINILIPYADSLKFLSEWFCQLWAESLGKDGKGMTPYPSVGTTDQHSQLQLWMEGPEDKAVTFMRVGDYGVDFTIPSVFRHVDGISYLGGQLLSSLIKAEEESSELALARRGRPNMTIHVPQIDAYHLGQLFQFFGVATAFTGLLLNIDPFNQPGVEEGKNYTYGMMGKKGFEAKRAEVEEARARKSRWGI